MDPPTYSHCSLHQMQRFANKLCVTFHCAQCQPCRVCKGKLLQINNKTGRVTYFPLKGCSYTAVPADPAVCKDNDLVRDLSAPDNINGTIYPLNVSKVRVNVPSSTTTSTLQAALTTSSVPKAPPKIVATMNLQHAAEVNPTSGSHLVQTAAPLASVQAPATIVSPMEPLI